MTVILFSYLPAILGILLIALFVFYRQRRPSYVAFALTLVFVVLWLTLQMLSFMFSDDIATWLIRFSILLSNFMTPAFLIFAMLYPNAERWPRISTSLLIFTPAALFLPLSFSSNMVAEVQNVVGGQSLTTGFLYDIQTIYTILYVLAALAILGWKAIRSAQKDRSAIILLFMAFLFPLIIGVMSNYIWINLPGSYYLLPLALLATSLTIAYAMFRYGLFDIRVVVARTVAYLMLLSTLVIIYAAAIFITARLLFNESSLDNGQAVMYFVFALLLAMTYTPLKRFFDKLTNNIFFRHEYDIQDVLVDVGDTTANEIDVKKLSNSVLGILDSTIKPEYIYLYIHAHKVHPAREFKQPNDIAPVDIDLSKAVKGSAERVIVTDHLTDADRKRQQLLAEANIATIVHLETSRKSIGYLVLGPKRSGDVYSEKDVRLLKSTGNELTVAIQSSLRFEEIQDFNETLQEKVDSATHRLQRANTRLRQLDATKDEFVSMASHQLRTPLTSVKGYLSMVLEGDAGKLNPAQEKLLKEAFTSSERMVRLIGDFLNVSRLRTGKFVVEKRTVNMADLVEAEVSQLASTAKTRELDLTYEKPADFPDIQIDKGKIQQVIMNLIDNAIFYSKPKGKITVELFKKKNEIVLRVKDGGIGVPAQEKKRLFTKFYRASNARKQRPDGTGIGLFMAQKVVIAHGGSMIFESTEGKGSTFGFRLPIVLSEEDEARAATVTERSIIE